MKNTIKYISLGLVSVMALSACSDSFLEDKKNYDNVTGVVYNNIEGANARLNDLYGWCLPQVADLTTGTNYLSVSIGNNDIAGGSTEEYSGFTDFTNPQKALSSMNVTNGVPDYFMGTHNNIQNAVYGRIRNINDFIEGIKAGTLSEEDKNIMLGQAYFFRAWCYYNLVKWYGGVPIVTEVLEPTVENFTPRSNARTCIEFMCNDLDQSAKLLAAKTMNGGWPDSDWGRITTGTALALKGRVLLMWCSPLFNRTNNKSRWESAYTMMKQELDSINACGYGLYSSGSNVNGSDFAKQFLSDGINPEAVFVALHNNIVADGSDIQRNNNWERSIRPKNTGGSGKTAGLALIELFPMADGKMPDLTNLATLKTGSRTYANTYSHLERSQYTYDESAPYMNRDPRFYRTFAFPGFRWAYQGDATQADANNPSYNGGKNYVLWNYVWFVDQKDEADIESGNSYAADNLLGSKAGVYVRKKSDDLDVNGSPLYNYDPIASQHFYSGAPLIELRYAEVLLNLAEVACGAGKLEEAVGYLKQIRARAGYTAANNYGLQEDLTSNQAACMSAILYERQIEFAYEGKRFDDMRRWMLFDGGTMTEPQADVDAEQVTLPDSWKVTGWGGNTCTWLGFTPWNGQRRERVEFRTADKFGIGGTTYNSDPFLVYYQKVINDSLATKIKAEHTGDSNWTNDSVDKYIAKTYNTYEMAKKYRVDAVDFKKADINTQLTNLKTWYNTNLVTTYKLGDSRDSQKNALYNAFRPKYYFLGLSQGAMNKNSGLQQTCGWKDYSKGGANGTFDPLAE